MVPTGPLLTALSESVILLDGDGAEVDAALGIVALDTVVQDEGLWLKQSTVSIPANDRVLGTVEVADRLKVRGEIYMVQLVQWQSDPGWKRLTIAPCP